MINTDFFIVLPCNGLILYTHGFNEPLLLKLKNTDGSLIWDQRLYATQTSGQVRALSLAIEGKYIGMTGNNITGIEFNSTLYSAPNNKDFYSVILEDSLTYYLGLNEKEQVFSSRIYPNPTKHYLTISSPNIIQEIKLFDTKGSLVQSFIANTRKTTINIGFIHAGFYYIQLKTNDYSEIHKFLRIN